jgi:hypothetical protein
VGAIAIPPPGLAPPPGLGRQSSCTWVRWGGGAGYRVGGFLRRRPPPPDGRVTRVVGVRAIRVVRVRSIRVVRASGPAREDRVGLLPLRRGGGGGLGGAAGRCCRRWGCCWSGELPAPLAGGRGREGGRGKEQLCPAAPSLRGRASVQSAGRAASPHVSPAESSSKLPQLRRKLSFSSAARPHRDLGRPIQGREDGSGAGRALRVLDGSGPAPAGGLSPTPAHAPPSLPPPPHRHARPDRPPHLAPVTRPAPQHVRLARGLQERVQRLQGLQAPHPRRVRLRARTRMAVRPAHQDPHTARHRMNRADPAAEASTVCRHAHVAVDQALTVLSTEELISRCPHATSASCPGSISNLF